MHKTVQYFAIALILLTLPSGAFPQNAAKKFEICEKTISELLAEQKAGRITARQIVEAYLKRIETYDKSTRLNSIVIINPDAVAEADKLDREFKRTHKLRPMHGIPIIVKDNFNTKGLQTTGGSIALKGNQPPKDAYQVRKLREAGAIILAKSNMAEWAFSPVMTESSISGVTRNPYDLERVPAGSSGGTAAAIAANLGALGLGSDTGDSIRGPSAHAGLVGIRSTMGLASRAGIIPLYQRNDIGGPMARSLEDAVRVLELIAGYDPDDPVTERSKGKVPSNYRQFLKKDSLKGVKLGVFRRYLEVPTVDPQVKQLFTKAIEELKAQGAIIVDPFDVPGYDDLIKNIWCNTFHHDVNQYLASLGPENKFPNLKSIVDAGLYSPYIERRLKDAINSPSGPPTCQDLYHEPKNIAFRESLTKAMDAAGITAVIYPTWSNPPRKVGDLQSPGGDNSQILSPQTGMPAITVPMGFIYGELPAGMTFLGRLFDEPSLIKLVYSYEQTTKHRHPPKLFPEL